MIGKTVLHYKIIEKLGEGGMGVVYRAQDEKLDRPVAIKMLPHKLAASEIDKQRFIQEAKAASALNHPNVATVYGIEESGDDVFIVFEYIEDGTLLTKRDLSIGDVVTIAREIAEGLKAAHSRGIVHRDIKSENVMVTPRGSVKITDFGVAKLAGGSKLTTPGMRVGTLAYTSPEQIKGGEVDHRTDLWSLGVLLYDLLTGDLPFNGEYDAALLYEILNSDPKAMQSYRDDVPENLQILISRLLEKEPKKRIASAQEVIDLLNETETTTTTATDSDERSICVLYFENMSPDKENEYVCAGITEDIITDLSNITGLNVVSRSDVLPFRNREINPRDLGESLGVDYVLEGSVRKSGDKLRITTQLTDVKSGFHVWAERFDRLVEDIFEVQNEVANKIAEALKISLTDTEKETLAQKPTDDVRAYDFYLRAREFLSHRGKKKAEAAIQMLRNALAIDPEFVLAYTGLAEAYSQMYTYYDGDQSWPKKIVEVSRKALDLDPGLVEAHFSLGIVHFHEKKFEKAMEILEGVIDRRPYYYEAYWWMGIIADILGEFDRALEYYELAAAIKPYSVEPWLYMNMTHRRKGDLKAAKLSAKRFLEVGLRKLEVNPNDAVTLSRFAVIYTLFDEHEKARGALGRILADKPDDGLVLYNCASTYALLNDRQQAIICLRTALENGFKNICEWVKSDPDFDELRNTDEFQSLLAEFEQTPEV